MAKFYSIVFFFLTLFFTSSLVAQNVGIGTSSPKEKLDVNGAIRIGNTTDSLIGTIRYNISADEFEGRDSTGWIPLGGGQDDDWQVVGDDMVAGVNGNIGVGIYPPVVKLHVYTDSIISLGGQTGHPFGVGVIGLASGYLPVLPPTGKGAGGVFAGHSGIFGYTQDSTGYGILSFNSSPAGGYAALFGGDLDMRGAIRNTDSTLYGGSVAVNDGMTVGTIAGSSCFPNSSITNVMFADSLPSLLFFNGESNTYNNEVYVDSGDCRSITSVYYECTFIDGEDWPIDVDVYMRGQYLGEVAISSANVYNLTSTPSHFVKQDTVFSDFYTTWSFTSNLWNGTDPDSVNWYVKVENFGTDSDYWHSYRATVFYKYGYSSAAPLYADFGEIRASGTLYANSTNAYGDVAEFFRVQDDSRTPEPGDIVSIDNRNPEVFNLSSKPYDPLLAGVVSENPSVFLNDPNAGEPIALTGRVKVKVNTEGGAIKPGDPITSSSVKGVGMKAGRSGLILGQALEHFNGAHSEEGKIWILIGKSHYENIKDIEAVEGKEVELSGVTINGAKKVDASANTVFVAWNEQMPVEMPTDIEFEDLVIDLTPYGGSAQLFVEDVHSQGFTVSINEATAKFRGFYYKVDLVSDKLDHTKLQVARLNSTNDIINSGSSVQLLDKGEIRSANQRRMEIASQLEQLTGKSLRNIPSLKSGQSVNDYKHSVVDSWKSADAALYNELKTLEEQLYASVNADRTLIRELRAVEK